MITKCFTSSCCRAYNSPWLQMFPERFLPPPVVLQEEGNTVKLATPGNLPDGFCYIDPSHAARFNIELSELPYDTYCPSSEGTLPDRTCPVCLTNFPSKAQMLVHKRSLHKYSRAKLSDDFQENLFELSTEVESVVAKSADGYTCVLRNGYVDAKELPESHPEVVKFLEKSKQKSPMPETSLSEWAKMIPSAKGN